MLSDMSYRFKIPLSLSLAILFTGLVVTAALTWLAYEDLRDELFHDAEELGSMLSQTLPAVLKHDDLWRAYRILEAATTPADSRDERLLIILDSNRRVYVSNQPTQVPVLSELHRHSPELARVEQAIGQGRLPQPYPFEDTQNQRIYVIIPMVDDGVILATLIIGYSRSLFLPRFYGIVRRVAFSSLAVMAILLPLSWYLGKRMVTPLIHLADCLSRVGRQPPDQIEYSLHQGNDEIGQLGIHFREMLDELQEKQRLERQMIASERLAAVGRLAAGVAHEINNPLGGMLNAISTFRRYGRSEPVTEKTLSLLERGLEQIRDTVSALLVEARSESHALAPEDIEDIHTLLQPDAHRKAIRLNWENSLSEQISLPSTQIRQVLINLSLNAVQAAPEGSTVGCHIHRDKNLLYIQVDNETDGITPTEINMFFEPFAHHDATRSGLGLWITYQIVQQLGGEIGLKNEAGHTCFIVQLPLLLKYAA